MFSSLRSTVSSSTNNNSCSYISRMSVTNDAGDEKPSQASLPLARRTVSCVLCGGVQIYPGPRYENHLVNEHGAVFDVDFLIELSVFKQKHGRLPMLSQPVEENRNGSTASLETGTCVRYFVK